MTLLERVRDRAAAAGLLPPWGRPVHHPVFARFPPGAAKAVGQVTDYLGVVTDPKMLPAYWRTDAPQVPPPPPAFGEEYFEWIDLLEAVEAACERFTMIELGAGYARWSARGWVAAQRRGLAVRLGVVEAEPMHAQWAREHLASNGVPEVAIDLREVALGATPGQMAFLTEMPAGGGNSNARDWYGQALAWQDPASGVPTGQDYCGHSLLQFPDGWRGVTVPVATLPDILADYEVVDLVDFDIQGAEQEVIGAAAAELTQKVRRLHVGTHSRQIDSALPRILLPFGWQLLRSYACLRWNRTEFGWMSFNDGVQTWVNPRLS